MDNELRELYQEVILDHNKSPRNYKKLEHHTHESAGRNPLCGDHLHVYVELKEGKVDDISFEGNGCAISKSSASLMTSIVKGKSAEEAEVLFRKFQDLVTGKIDNAEDLSALGKLAVFQGVREFPIRVKCASLAWHTLHAALKDDNKVVTTE